MFSKFNTAAKSPADQTSRKLQQVAKANKSNTSGKTSVKREIRKVDPKIMYQLLTEIKFDSHGEGERGNVNMKIEKVVNQGVERNQKYYAYEKVSYNRAKEKALSKQAKDYIGYLGLGKGVDSINRARARARQELSGSNDALLTKVLSLLITEGNHVNRTANRRSRKEMQSRNSQKSAAEIEEVWTEDNCPDDANQKLFDYRLPLIVEHREMFEEMTTTERNTRWLSLTPEQRNLETSLMYFDYKLRGYTRGSILYGTISECFQQIRTNNSFETACLTNEFFGGFLHNVEKQDYQRARAEELNFKGQMELKGDIGQHVTFPFKSKGTGCSAKLHCYVGLLQTIAVKADEFNAKKCVNRGSMFFTAMQNARPNYFWRDELRNLYEFAKILRTELEQKTKQNAVQQQPNKIETSEAAEEREEQIYQMLFAYANQDDANALTAPADPPIYKENATNKVKKAESKASSAAKTPKQPKYSVTDPKKHGSEQRLYYVCAQAIYHELDDYFDHEPNVMEQMAKADAAKKRKANGGDEYEYSEEESIETSGGESPKQ